MTLRCIECRRESATGRHWRAYLADDPRDDDPPELALYCPSCAEREFGEEFQEVGDSVDETLSY